jgi:hypothetical protein
MMTNDEMKAGRYLKLHQGRQKFAKLQAHLAAGGSFYICTSYRATKVSPKHTDMIRLGKSGSIYVQRGKAWDCIDYCAIRIAAIGN